MRVLGLQKKDNPGDICQASLQVFSVFGECPEFPRILIKILPIVTPVSDHKNVHKLEKYWRGAQCTGCNIWCIPPTFAPTFPGPAVSRLARCQINRGSDQESSSFHFR